MKTQILFISFLASVIAFAATNKKGLSITPGAEWVLRQDLQMQKAPSSPDDSGHYAAVWNLRAKTFSKLETANKDSCLIKSIATPENLSDSAVVLPKQTTFKVIGMQESPSPSMIFDIAVNGAKKEEVHQIQFICTAYEKGLNTEKDRKEFRDLMTKSLNEIFSTKK